MSVQQPLLSHRHSLDDYAVRCVFPCSLVLISLISVTLGCEEPPPSSDLTPDLSLAGTPEVIVDESAPTWPDGRIDLQALTPHSASISWSESVDDVAVTQYRVYLDGQLIQRLSVEDRAGDRAEREYTIDGLQPSTTYEISVESRDDAGHISDDGPTLEITTPDERAPVWREGAQLYIASVGERSVELTWEPAQDDVAVARYELRRDGDESSEPPLPIQLDAESSSARVDELAPDTTYTFSLVAIDGAENRSDAIEVVAQTRDTSAPTWPTGATLISDVINDTSAQVSWVPAEDEGTLTGYEVWQDLVLIDRVAVDQVTYELTDLDPGRAYLVQVIATDRAGQRSAPLELTIETTDSVAPQWPADAHIALTQRSEDHVQVRWPDAIDNVGVTGYRIDIDGVAAYEGDVSQRYADLTGLAPGVIYTVSIYAQDRAGQWSDALTSALQTLDDTPPEWASDVSLIVEAVSETALELRWPPAEDNTEVSAYLIYLDDQPGVRVEADILTHRFEGLEPWTIYGARVEAEGSAGQRSLNDLSGEARTLDETPPRFDQTPALRTLQVDSTEAVLTWVPADDQGELAGYRLYRGGESPELIAELIAELGPAEREHRLTELIPGQAYTFALEAFDAAGHQSDQQVVTFTTLDGAAPIWPEDAQLTVSEVNGEEVGGGEVTLIWTEAQDDVAIAQYHVFHQNILIDTVEASVRTISIRELTLNHIHVFRVEAEDTAGQVSVSGPTVSVDLSDQTPPSFPLDAALEASQVGPRSMTLSWTLATDDISVVSYRVEVEGADTDHSVVRQVNGELNSVIIDRLTPITEYTFQVIARDAVGRESSPLTLTTTTTDVDAPQWPEGAAFNQISIAPDSAQLMWTPALGEVARYVISNGVSIEEVIPADVNEWVVSDLTPDSTYSLSLMAIGPTGREVEVPLTLTLSTPVDAPPMWPEAAELEVVSQTENSVTVEWPLLDSEQRVARYLVSLNGEEIASVESTVQRHQVVGLNLGELYTIIVRAANQRGLNSVDGLSATLATQDLTAPTFTPDGTIAVVAQTVTTLMVSWSPAFDNVGVTGYTVYLDDVQIAQTSGDILESRSYLVSGLLPGTAYTLRVTARDEVGLESLTGLSAAVSTRSGEDIPTDEEVRAALAVHCSLCHDTWFTSTEALRDHIIAGRSGDFAQARVELDRPFISPGDPQGSLLVELLEGRAPEDYDSPMMPPTGFGGAEADFATLSANGETAVTILQIRDWIEVMEDTP